jgi:hypothetical protein
MSSIMVTFVVTAKQEEMREHLMRIGYLDRWFSENNIYLLPSTAMWKTDITPDNSINEIIRIAKNLNIELRTAIAVPSIPWAGVVSGSTKITSKG